MILLHTAFLTVCTIRSCMDLRVSSRVIAAAM